MLMPAVLGPEPPRWEEEALSHQQPHVLVVAHPWYWL